MAVPDAKGFEGARSQAEITPRHWRTSIARRIPTRPLYNAKTPDLRGLPSAAEWSRTITSR